MPSIVFPFFRSLCLLSVVIWLGLQGMSVWAGDNKSQQTDFMELAAVMLRDGHSDRALLALQSVDLEDEKTDLSRYYTLQGLAYLNLNDFHAAKDSLQSAVKSGQADSVIFVYLAQAHYSLKDYRSTIQAIDKSGAHAEKANLITLKAQAHWHLEEPAAAINALNEGIRLFPQDYGFLRRKVFYFVELQLFHEATQLGRRYLAQSKAAAEDYIAIGNALRLSRQYKEALDILEIARLQFNNNQMVAKLLAHTYLDQGQLNSAAFILEQAALLNPDLLSEAAEVYRRANRFHKALTLNEGVQDQKIKLKQRLSILLALKQFERAANMESALYRTGLLEDQHVRYALAYAYFSSGRFAEANKHLDHLSESELFRKGVELRRLMQVCKEEPWKCI
ncbi:tetratricopeptide repeat protein [Nitrosomonas aestuarii]|uniref:tetratricopeptide repeat protein n=1 Tax=Nitrosomonas aestuarii TaxID=52441 RepID=UPI001FD21C7F|nr:tetratricopeptide repeat protein [Nitrosomonas aestuarii]